MPRSRTTKTIAKRIDLTYFKRRHPMRSWRSALTWLAGVAALLWFVFASVRFSGGKLTSADQIHSPGPVTSAHALFESDCSACHAPASGGSFLLSVRDESCLKCHDGAIHHRNQKLAAEASLVSRDSATLALREPSHPGEARSAACATCHVEHRGRQQLAATSDAHCTVCHADLAAATTDAKPLAPNAVVRFDLAGHPTFGRKLRSTSGGWIDPTVVKFNHQYHLEKVDEIRNNAANCMVCHAPDPLNRRYMKPISYERDCRSCHELRIAPEAAPVAHEDMAIVRAQLKDLPGLYMSGLGALSEEERKKLLVKTERQGRTTRTVQVPAEQWVSDKVRKLTDEAKGAATTQPATESDSAALEQLVAFGMSQSCSKCHEVKAAQSAGEWTTVATGIGASPRRWFAASVFDHDAHRNLGCRDCHFAAWTSKSTSDLLMPDINLANSGAQTCLMCHVAQSPSGARAAPADCVTCHTFHDRHLEASPPSGRGSW